ncbi:Tbingi protein, partial [Trypanosoma theileri]
KRIYAPRPLSTPAIKINNTVLTENQKAKHFIRLYSRKAKRHPHSYPPPPIPVTDTEFIPITAAELERAQRLLPKGTAAAPDGIYGEALSNTWDPVPKRRLLPSSTRVSVRAWLQSLGK